MVSQTVSKGIEIFVPVTFLTVDCGKCGSTDFELKVLPQVVDGAHKAKLYAVQCSGCENVLNVDNQRFLEGKDKSLFNPLIKPRRVG